MRVYYAEQNLIGSEDSRSDKPEWLYFRSHTEAKKWANSVIKEFVALSREYDKGFSLNQIGWGAEVIVRACDFVSTGKDMLILLLNDEGGYFENQEVTDRWTPADKWKAPLTEE